ncbi:hypothetical protein D9757_012529 [Collybiopsis confluens]|uniref:Uncharacterized protein n=1 Tax=Collybiopsis confluens TaxID=2823264 RepID=A0A8H5LG83_9AGAR|nr:hypothetical protein D9757_012529 [Collybiopsis confluens]
MATTTTSSLDFPCPSTSSFQVLVDDSDLAQIKYSDGWLTAGARGFECNATTHGSVHVTGTHTTATFSFEGIGVQVYGTIAPNGIPTSTYQLDDLALFTFTFNANTGNTTNYRVQYYASPVLEPGNHTLVISSDGPVGSSQMFLDYIIYNPVPSYVSDASSGAGTSTSSALPSITSLSGSGPSTSHSAISFSTGALAGGIIGGTILGLLLGILFSLITFWKRKQRNSTSTDIDILTEATGDRTSSSVSMPAQSYTQSYNAFSQTHSSTMPVVLSPPVRNRNYYIPDRKNRPPKSSSEPMIIQNGGAGSGSGSEMEEEIRSQPPAYAN